MKYTKQDASGIIADMLQNSGMMLDYHQTALDKIRKGVLYGKFLDSESFGFEIEGVWGSQVTLDIDGQTGVSLSWSSTGRGIASSFATIDLYTQVAKLGARIQAFMDGCEIKAGKTEPMSAAITTA